MIRDESAEDEAAEIPLMGGNVSASVEALLEHLASVGFEGAPKPLGRDERGRQVLEFVPGTMADAMAPMTRSELRRVGRLIRDFHDAAAEFAAPADATWSVPIPPDSEDLICHHDLAPWNLVRSTGSGSGERWVFIDWDGAGPGSRLWDLAYAAHGFLPMGPAGDPDTDGPRLRALADGYGLDEQQRRRLPALIVGHTRGMFELLRSGSLSGEQPWARLWSEGHGEHWGPAASYIEQHLEAWHRALLA
jgi:Ser/Thr protein kinase RdoA (MazF antagonist)